MLSDLVNLLTEESLTPRWKNIFFISLAHKKKFWSRVKYIFRVARRNSSCSWWKLSVSEKSFALVSNFFFVHLGNSHHNDVAWMVCQPCAPSSWARHVRLAIDPIEFGSGRWRFVGLPPAGWGVPKGKHVFSPFCTKTGCFLRGPIRPV